MCLLERSYYQFKAYYKYGVLALYDRMEIAKYIQSS